MAPLKKTVKVCSKGHNYYKSSDCPTCPICEAAKKPSSGFLSLLSAPARRAIENKGIGSLKQLSSYTEKEIIQLHGMGKTTIPILTAALKEKGLALKKETTTFTKPSEPEAVDVFMKKLKHPLLKEAAALRKIILAADKKIGEDISWNAPNFFYTGPMKPFNPKEYKRIIVTFNLFQKDCIRLIFLTGGKLKDSSGFLQGDYADGRRIAYFYSMDDVKQHEKKLQQLLKKWLSLVGK